MCVGGWVRSGGGALGESYLYQRANKNEERLDVLPRGRFKGIVWTPHQNIIKLGVVRVENNVWKEGQRIVGWGVGVEGEHPAAHV